MSLNIRKQKSPPAPAGGRFLLVWRETPFTERKIRHEEVGGTVLDIVTAIAPHPNYIKFACVSVGYGIVPREKWAQVRPKAGTTVGVVFVPKGGGGRKNPLATVLQIGLLFAAPGIGNALAAAAGGGIIWNIAATGISWGRVLAGGISLVGGLLINALAPPPRPRTAPAQASEGQTKFISGGRNALTPYGAVPQVLGRHRFMPPLAATPYTETSGDDQYIRMLFCLGLGPLDISSLRIGDTDIENFSGVDVEIRQGYPDDEDITLYSNTPRETPLSLALTVAGGASVQTTETETDEISVDLTLPQGLFRLKSSGAKAAETVQVQVQYAPTGTSDWTNAAGSYTAISAQISPEMPKPSGSNRRRYYRVYLDPASGALGVVAGAVQSVAVPEKPIIPTGTLAIALVLRASSDTSAIGSGAITDERLPANVGDYFETEDDFEPGVSGTSNVISIAAGGLAYPGFKITANQSSALRRSIHFRVPRGQYDVRLTRITADPTTDTVYNATMWTALRSIKYTDPVQLSGLALIALRIKATDQLNGVVDTFNCIAHSIVPDWDGESWTPAATSNPASLLRHVLQGSANARPLADARLNIDQLQTWHEFCDDNGFSYNNVIDGQRAVLDMAQAICAAGRASFSDDLGKWTVAIDNEKPYPVQHFTPRNTWGFKGQVSWPVPAHALRVKYRDEENDWQENIVTVYDDGYSKEGEVEGTVAATVFEPLDLTDGTTNFYRAWLAGKYHIASARLRGETFSFNADVENLVCARGDLVRFTHDVPLFGLGSGRVKTVIVDESDPPLVTGLVLDDAVTMETGKTYTLRLRQSDGESLLAAIDTDAGEQTEVTFSTPQEVESSLLAGALYMFGETGSESVELLVRSISPQSDMSAVLTCIPYAPALFDITFETLLDALPEYESQVSIPAEMRLPPAPVVAETHADESVMVLAGNAWQPAIVIVLAPPAYGARLETLVYVYEADGTTLVGDAAVTTAGSKITITGITAGETYIVKVTYKNISGMYSLPAVQDAIEVTAGYATPADVTGLFIAVNEGVATLSWDDAPLPGVKGFEVRFAPAEAGTATWGGAALVQTDIKATVSAINVPSMNGTFFIKALNIAGGESENAASVSVNVFDLVKTNVIETYEHAPDFFGHSGETVSIEDGLCTWEHTDYLEEGAVTFIHPEILDLGYVCSSRLSASISYFGRIHGSTFESIENIDEVENIDDIGHEGDAGIYTLRSYVSTLDSDPWFSGGNLFAAGNDFASWTAEGCTVTADAALAPDGTMTAAKITEDSSTGAHCLSIPVTLQAGRGQVLTMFIKAGEHEKLAISGGSGDIVSIDAASWTGDGYSTFSIAHADKEIFHVQPILESANELTGWRKIYLYIAGVANDDTELTLKLWLLPAGFDFSTSPEWDPASGVSYTGDGASSIYVWNAEIHNRAAGDGVSPEGVGAEGDTREDWTDWQEIRANASVTARALKFKTEGTARALTFDEYESLGGREIVIDSMKIVVDMPDSDRAARAVSGAAGDAGGTQVTFSAPFRAVPSIVIAAHDMVTGDYYTITDAARDGFKIAFFDSADARVTRVFDYIAKGYGRSA